MTADEASSRCRPVSVWVLSSEGVQLDNPHFWSAEDREALARLRDPEARHASRVARALARVVLAAQNGVTPRDVGITRCCWRCGKDAGHGKPYSRSHPSTRFSSSHSGPWVAVAVAKSEIGVDIERVEGSRIGTWAARSILHPAEWAQPEALDLDDLLSRWVRKEAVVKCLGRGLATPLKSFAVSAGLAPAELLTTPAVAEDPFALADFRTPALRGAIAVAGSTPVRVVVRDGLAVLRSLSLSE